MGAAEMQLTVHCDQCGKKYGFIPEKLNQKETRFRCKQCANIVTIILPDEQAPDSTTIDTSFFEAIEQAPASNDSATVEIPGDVTPPPADTDGLPDWVTPFEAERAGPAEVDFATPIDEPNQPVPVAAPEPEPEPEPAATTEAKKGLTFGLTAKFIIAAIIPFVLIFAVVVGLANSRIGELQTATIEESRQAVRSISEGMIRQVAVSISQRAHQYLLSQPGLRKENFNRDINFKNIAAQTFGATGTTALYEIPGSAKGAWRLWAHQDPKFVGTDLRALKQRLGKDFAAYWRVVSDVKKKDIVGGYCLFFDKQGKKREHYMVNTRIEGTPFVLSASILVDELIKPLDEIEVKGKQIAERTRYTLISVIGAGLLVVFVVLLFYGRRFTARIRGLTDWADRISMGELESESIEVRSKDEIGELSDAIARMQTSIRLSIQRLRRRRR